MPDQNSRSSTSAAKGGLHSRDLRFAGGISAGLISAILVGGALLAPVADWNGLGSSRSVDDTQVVQLADLPASHRTPADGGSGGSGDDTGGTGGGAEGPSVPGSLLVDDDGDGGGVPTPGALPG